MNGSTTSVNRCFAAPQNTIAGVLRSNAKVPADKQVTLVSRATTLATNKRAPSDEGLGRDRCCLSRSLDSPLGDNFSCVEQRRDFL